MIGILVEGRSEKGADKTWCMRFAGIGEHVGHAEMNGTSVGQAVVLISFSNNKLIVIINDC